MKWLFALMVFTVLTRSNVVGQDFEAPTDAAKPKRFSVGVLIGGDATTFFHNPFKTLVHDIYIPGSSFDLGLSVRLGKHFELQATPGYTFRPYDTHKQYVGDNLDENGNPDQFYGKNMDRELRADLHESRAGIMTRYYFTNNQKGGFIGLGVDMFRIYLRDMVLVMKQDSVEFLRTAKDVFDLPWIPGVQLSGGYIGQLHPKVRFSMEPYVRFSIVEVTHNTLLSWGCAGFRMGVWL